jgi:hypothetical protein
MEMNDCVWVSNALGGSVNHAGFMTDLLVEKGQEAFEFDRRNEQGEPLSADYFPRKAWLLPEDAKRKKLPDFRKTGSFALMSERCADVFRAFDMGGGNLFPVGLFEADRATPLSGNWFAINFGNVKASFLPEQSSNFIPVAGKKFVPLATWPDFSLAFDSLAQEGPDVWIDPLLFQTFCMSDELVTALRESDLFDNFEPLRRGRIVR